MVEEVKHGVVINREVVRADARKDPINFALETISILQAMLEVLADVTRDEAQIWTGPEIFVGAVAHSSGIDTYFGLSYEEVIGKIADRCRYFSSDVDLPDGWISRCATNEEVVDTYFNNRDGERFSIDTRRLAFRPQLMADILKSISPAIAGDPTDDPDWSLGTPGGPLTPAAAPKP